MMGLPLELGGVQEMMMSVPVCVKTTGDMLEGLVAVLAVTMLLSGLSP